jgi:type IV pilus assembly protein PilF
MFTLSPIKARDNMMFIKIFLLILLGSLFSGCQSTSSVNEVADKKVAIAKINTTLGLAYLERHDIKRAKQKLLIALKEAPTLPEAWYTMGYFLESTDNKAQASKYYLKAIQLAPGRGDALNNYGTFLCRSGNYQGAIQQFLKAVQDPNYLELAAAYENAGLCSLRIPNSKAAMHYFKKALAEDPNRPTSLIELAELHVKQKKYSVARHALDRYLQLAEPNAQSFLLEQKIDEKLNREYGSAKV